MIKIFYFVAVFKQIRKKSWHMSLKEKKSNKLFIKLKFKKQHSMFSKKNVLNYQIKREFEACRVFNPSSSSASFNSTLQRCHVFGPGIYIGWMAMFLLLCAGALMACGSHRVDEENKDSRVYRLNFNAYWFLPLVYL